jgi:hypothetical protein
MVKISSIDPTTLVSQTFNVEDSNIIQSDITSSLFNIKTDTVEYFIYDLNNNLLTSNLNYNNWSVINDPSIADNNNFISTIEIDPITDLTNFGYTFGKLKTVYNFVSPKLNSSSNNKFFISEISSDRTEIRLKSNFISNDSLQISYDIFKTEIEKDNYFDEFYLNFGNNQLALAVNILLDTSKSQYSLLIKLYEALPSQFQLKSEPFIVTKTAESIGYEVEFEDTININAGLTYIKPANFNLNILDKINNTTDYKTYNSLLNTSSSSSLYQILNYISGSNIKLNINYTDYNNFINFSSATQRLYNFRQKLISISSSQSQLNIISSSISGPTSSSIFVSASKEIIENQIQNIITEFDEYENYLYYQSSSYTWPKQNTNPPYILFDPTSSQAINWYTTQSITASLYDSNNQNYLYYTIPSFIREDSSNDPYLLFVDMVGQLFDEIWLYTKNITEKLDSNNNLDIGVSKDIVANVLESLGIKLYASNFTTENLYNTLIGLNPDGGYLIPTGSELITNYVTSSISASLVPTIDNYNKLIYKKIYHNLPYLLKKKGTIQGLRALINLFGVPDTILRINEFGDKDKNPNTWDQWQNEFNYTFTNSGLGRLTIPFTASSSPYGTTFPKAIEFRFKTSGLPTSSIPYSQSLFVSSGSATRFGVFLEYTGSGYTSGSYTGSIKDTNYQYATLKFISGSLSSSVYLPFYDGGWWSVLINANSSSATTYTLYAKNKIYDGVDGNTIGFQASSSFTGSNFWTTTGSLVFGTGSILNGKTYNTFSGSYQEIRYYNILLSESVFDAYVMNPSSIEGNTLSGSQSSKNSLFFRLPLGGELYTGSTSVHPGITGSSVTQSFTGASSTGSFSGSYSFITNTETIFYDQPAVGIKNVVSNKIKTFNTILPTTSSIEPNIPNNKILSKYISVQQDYPISSSYTNDINYTEIAFSPQNEINEDIMSSLGYFNIGDYIGDPRQISSSNQSYPDLDTLRDLYFEKYSSNYDWNDFIRLIKFFDNSLFKMFQDFIPAKTSLASGIVIKQHLLERNKYPVPQIGITQSEYTASISTYYVTGSDGGSFPDLSSGLYSQVTQSWDGFNSSYSGSIPFTQNDLSEFFDGELSGSLINIRLNETGYQPIIINDYSASVLPVPPTITFSSGSKFPIPYEIDYNKIYYLSFNYGNMTAGNFISIVDNNDKVLFQTVNSPGSGSVITEIKEASYPISFLTNNSPSPFLSASNVLIQEYQLVNPSLAPLLNNVLDNRLSSEFMDIDYSNNSIIPINQQLLLSGSANKFPVPDSNYTALGMANARYFGSKTTSPNFNKPIYNNPSNTFINNQYSISTPSTESQIPNASKYSNWFIYFDYIESAYPEVPGGGNVHAVYAINTEGQTILLTEDNSYVDYIANTFSKGVIANISPAVYSAGTKNPQVTIFDGGAKYQTIVTLSGSTAGIATGSFGIIDPTSPFVGAISSDAFIVTGSNRNTLIDASSTPLGADYVISLLLSNTPANIINMGGYVYVYNKSTNQYVSGSYNTRNSSITVSDTLFPVKAFDFIRLGDARVSGSGINSFNSSSLDYSFTSMGLFAVADTNDVSFTITISPSINATVANNLLIDSGSKYLSQNWRVFRRLPDETNIVLTTFPTFTDPGFLIPENFNPNYDVYDLAKKAGIIT